MDGKDDYSELTSLLPPKRGGMSRNPDKVRRKVQWNDNTGNKLLEILEFEPRVDRGQALKLSYIHLVDPFHTVPAEMTHRFSTYESSFIVGSSHVVNPLTVVIARLSDNGKVSLLCQHEWSLKSTITFSAEHDSKAMNSAASKFGLALALKP